MSNEAAKALEDFADELAERAASAEPQDSDATPIVFGTYEVAAALARLRATEASARAT